MPEAKPTKMSEPENFNEPSNPQVEVEPGDSGQPNRRRRQRSRQIDPSVNMDELRELIDLIQENDFAEFEIAREGFVCTCDAVQQQRKPVAARLVLRSPARDPNSQPE